MRFLGLLVIALIALAGCTAGNSYDSNAAGAESNAGKTYTKDDARAAQPVRGGSEGN